MDLSNAKHKLIKNDSISSGWLPFDSARSYFEHIRHAAHCHLYTYCVFQGSNTPQTSEIDDHNKWNLNAITQNLMTHPGTFAIHFHEERIINKM